MVPLLFILMFMKVVLSQRIDVFPNTTMLVLEGENVSIIYKLENIQHNMWRYVVIKPSNDAKNHVAFFHKEENNVCVNTAKVPDRHKVSCDSSNLLFRLDIYNVTKMYDNISYICELSTNGIDKRSKTTNSTRIKVKDPAECIEIKPHSISVVKDETIELECKATCYPLNNITITWHKQMSRSTTTKVISNNSTNAYPSEYVSKLTYNVNQNNINGFIYCTATYAFTNRIITSEKVEISVQYGPQNTMISVISYSTIGEKFAIIENEDFKATCTADCLPSCQYQWWTTDNKNFISQNSELVIANIKRKNEGQIVCQAKNNFGKRNKTVNVIVFYPSIVTHIRFTNNKTTINEQENTTIECSVDGRPLPNITWSRNGKELYNEQSTNNSVLVISKADCYHTGNYKCSSFNGIGHPVSQQIVLYVNCKPSIIGSKMNRQEIGGNVTITVYFFAFPSPNITWYFHPENDRNQIEKITNTSMISIDSNMFMYISRLQVDKDDGIANGRYRIEIYNSLGNDHMEITLNDRVQRSTTTTKIKFQTYLLCIITIVLTIATAVPIGFLIRKKTKVCRRKGTGNRKNNSNENQNIENIGDSSKSTSYVSEIGPVVNFYNVVDNRDYENACRIKELEADSPYEDLEPEDKVKVSIEWPYESTDGTSRAYSEPLKNKRQSSGVENETKSDTQSYMEYDPANIDNSRI